MGAIQGLKQGLKRRICQHSNRLPYTWLQSPASAPFCNRTRNLVAMLNSNESLWQIQAPDLF